MGIQLGSQVGFLCCLDKALDVVACWSLALVEVIYIIHKASGRCPDLRCKLKAGVPGAGMARINLPYSSPNSVHCSVQKQRNCCKYWEVQVMIWKTTYHSSWGEGGSQKWCRYFVNIFCKPQFLCCGTLCSVLIFAVDLLHITELFFPFYFVVRFLQYLLFFPPFSSISYPFCHELNIRLCSPSDSLSFEAISHDALDWNFPTLCLSGSQEPVVSVSILPLPNYPLLSWIHLHVV